MLLLVNINVIVLVCLSCDSINLTVTAVRNICHSLALHVLNVVFYYNINLLTWSSVSNTSLVTIILIVFPMLASWYNLAT